MATGKTAATMVTAVVMANTCKLGRVQLRQGASTQGKAHISVSTQGQALTCLLGGCYH